MILDNFEHVLAAATAVSELLTAAPGLKVLVSSRASLQVSAEHTYPVPSLPAPSPDDLPRLERLSEVESVRLFLQRAQAVRPEFALTSENAKAVAALCVRLDGLPLEIELAAARVRLLSPQAMLAHLDKRLGFLTTGPRDLPARQRTLRATIDWSYDLLNEAEKAILKRIAVFEGGFTVEAAQAVANLRVSLSTSQVSIFDILESLVHQSLLEVSDLDSGPRFTMSETIREYALERLAAGGASDEQAARQRHADYFLALAEESKEAWRQYGAQQAAWVDRLQREQGNLRAALAWSIDHGIELALRLATALGDYWAARAAFNEGREWLAKALSKSADGGASLRPLRAWALNRMGSLAHDQGDAAAIAMQEESLAVWRELGDLRGTARALCALGAAWGETDRGKAFSLREEGIKLYRQTDDEEGLGGALTGYVFLMTRNLDKYETARASAEESLRLVHKFGNRALITEANLVLGIIENLQGNYGVAGTIFEEYLHGAREANDALGIIHALDNLGWVASNQGDHERARIFWEQSLQLWRDLGSKVFAARGLWYLARNAHAAGNDERANELIDETRALTRELDDQNKVRMGRILLSAVRGPVNPGEAWQAAATLRDSISLAQQVSPPAMHLIAMALVELVRNAQAKRQWELSAQILGAARRVLDRDNLQLEIRHQSEYERTLIAARAELGEAHFDEAWAAGQKMATADLDQVIAHALGEVTR